MSSLARSPQSYFSSTTNEIIIPTPETNIHTLIDRWSDERLSLPAIIVNPSTHDDIVAAIRYAKINNLTLVTGGGGHKVVPINEKTMYLDIRKFKEIAIGADRKTVTFGGAVTCLELMTAMYAEGLYTSSSITNHTPITYPPLRTIHLMINS
jgi:FAD/FMN-containing dehydrogenase